MGTQHQKFSLSLSGYTPAEREAIAVRVIDKIKERTQSGVDKDGNSFAPYSKEYKKSAAFKTAGKGSEVDLTLSGDMLDSIEILTNRSGKVDIGFAAGSAENGKADGNIRGTYGKDHKVGPSRKFLGISQAELRAILSDFPKGEAASKAEAYRVLSTVQNADILSGKVNVDDLEG